MGVRLLEGVRLLFLPKFPGATFIWGATLIWNSRVPTVYKIIDNRNKDAKGKFLYLANYDNVKQAIGLFLP